jgi:hypothetical protein
MSLTADVVIGKYIALRDKRSELKKAYTEADAPFLAAMEKCEVWLLQQCNAMGVDNLAVKGIGTAIKGKDMKVAGKDWIAFNAWARENDEMDMFERRIARTVLTSYMKDHEGAVPPGLDVIYEQVVTVRRATKEKEE